MGCTVGIGIATFNRKHILQETIERVRALTRTTDAAWVVADDGSDDGTLPMLREQQVPVITGLNMGIAWNKNRALFLLAHELGCRTVILLEDDTQPEQPGWEAEWVRAAQRWGHVNFAGDWLAEHFLAGTGSCDDPVRSRLVTAQCAAFSREALTYAGYFDPRFLGYGHEHVEHSVRLVRCGYGGWPHRIEGQDGPIFISIRGALRVVPSRSHANAEQEGRNARLAYELGGEQAYRAPWRDDRQMRQFRSEMASALGGGAERFALHPGRAGEVERRGRPGFWARLRRAA